MIFKKKYLIKLVLKKKKSILIYIYKWAAD